jgi:hypothetical protein
VLLALNSQDLELVVRAGLVFTGVVGTEACAQSSIVVVRTGVWSSLGGSVVGNPEVSGHRRRQA